MKKIVIFSVFLLLQGCSLNQFFLGNEIDKVHIIKHTSRVKIYRAYFSRETLKPIDHGKKYLFLYRPKYPKMLWVLLHRKSRYLLYPMTVACKSPRTFTHISRKTLLRKLAKQGYHQAKDLGKLGFVVHTGFRKYKGVKTIMIEVKRYTHTQHVSQKNIRKTSVSTTLQIDNGNQIEPLYPYYLHHASASEIAQYLKSPKSKKALSYGERNLLEHRLATLKKQDFLENASLEALISEYKKNRDPEFKKHILVRIKELEAN